ncbi:MAG: alpha/beta hydrolase-fold protein, partial [Verrucomicrobiales bacterium]
AVLCLTIPSGALAADVPAAGEQVEQSLETKAAGDMPYLLYLPEAYGQDGGGKRWPVILFLHGRGESRGPLSKVQVWGPPRMAARGDDLPYIIISPQCPADTRWTAPDQQAGVLELLEHIEETFSTDEDRVYLTGLSMGGFGSWKLAADHPGRFAAVAPICGKGDPGDGEKLTGVPIWAFHGTEDRSVPFSGSLEMVEAIKKAGGNKVRFTSLEGIGHNSWSAAYATPELYSWFNRFTRSGNRK